MKFFEEYLTRGDIVAAIQRDSGGATVLPEDVPRPDVFLPQAYSTLLRHPALFQHMDDVILERWGFKPHLLSYLVSGEEAVVCKVYGAPFVIKATTSHDSDLIHGSSFVAKPSARRSIMLKDEHAWEKGERPKMEIILERWLYPYNAVRNPRANQSEDWVLLEPEAKRLLEKLLQCEGLQFKDQKLSNVRYYGISIQGTIGDKPDVGYPQYPVITDAGALEGITKRNTLSDDPNKAEYSYELYRKIYWDLHNDLCPDRGKDAAKRIAAIAEQRWKQDSILYANLKKEGLSDQSIIERNMNLAAAREKNAALLYDAEIIQRSF